MQPWEQPLDVRIASAQQNILDKVAVARRV
jgi:hypothetical protein